MDAVLRLQRLAGNAAVAWSMTAQRNVLADPMGAITSGMQLAGDLTALGLLHLHTTPEQRRGAFANRQLMDRLGDELASAHCRALFAEWGIPFNERVLLMLQNGVRPATILATVPGAPADQRAAALADTEVVRLVKMRFVRDDALDMVGMLEFGSRAALAAPSAEAPALTNRTVLILKDLIAETKYADALAHLVALLEGTAVLDPSQYASIEFRSASGTAVTETDWIVNRRTGHWRPDGSPSVYVGRGGFAGPASLYSTVLHEYQHVLADNAGYDEDPKTDWMIGAGEIGAYLWEIENAEKSGIIHEPAQMQEAADHLQENWKRARPAVKKPLKARYRAALAKVKAATTTPTPTPRP